MKVLLFLSLLSHSLYFVLAQATDGNIIAVPIPKDFRIVGRSIATITSPWRVSSYANLLKRKFTSDDKSLDSKGWTGIPNNETIGNSTGENMQRRDGSAVVGVKVTVSDAVVTSNSTSSNFIEMTKGANSYFKKDLSSYRALNPNPPEIQSSRMIVHYNNKPIEPVHQQSRIVVSAAPQLHPSGTIDPYHPVVQHSLNTPPHNPLQQPQHQRHSLPSNHHPHYAIRPKFEIRQDSLLPLDKTLVYVSMITTWIFWILTFTTYYSLWGPGHNVIRGYVPHVPHQHHHHRSATDETSKSNVVVPESTKSTSSQSRAQRSLDSSRWNFNWGQVIEMIRLAQESYEKFDFQSMDCQKKALCELSQKQEHFGETGRKISNTFSYVSTRVIDTLETLPMPTIVLQYLKEYKDAVNQGRNSGKECGVVYPKCEFSIKETFVKFQKKSVGKAHQPK